MVYVPSLSARASAGTVNLANPKTKRVANTPRFVFLFLLTFEGPQKTSVPSPGWFGVLQSPVSCHGSSPPVIIEYGGIW